VQNSYHRIESSHFGLLGRSIFWGFLGGLADQIGNICSQDLTIGYYEERVYDKFMQHSASGLMHPEAY
jgi:hypothetical protein